MIFIKKWSAPFLLLFTIFSEQIFHCYLSFRGLVSESGMLQYVFIAIFGGALFLLLRDSSHKFDGFRISKILVPMSIILMLYMLTSIFYETPPPRYYSSILRYGSACVGAAIIGMYVAKNPCFKLIDTLIPFFVIPCGLIIGILGVQSAELGEILKDESGLTYHTASYYMSEMYAYCMYYIFYSGVREESLGKWLRLPMLIMMFFCASICLLCGGRGATVFIVVVTILNIYLLHKVGRMSNMQIFLFICGCVLIFSIIAIKLDIFNSVGFNRVSNNLTEDNVRDSLRSSAINFFCSSPLFGHGIGSIWMTVGFYSHNMFLDLLVEGGFIFTLIVLHVLYLMYKRLFVLLQLDNSYIFFLLVLSKTFIVTMFSGYWIGAYQLWLVFGFVMILPRSYVNLKKKQYE